MNSATLAINNMRPASVKSRARWLTAVRTVHGKMHACSTPCPRTSRPYMARGGTMRWQGGRAPSLHCIAVGGFCMPWHQSLCQKLSLPLRASSRRLNTSGSAAGLGSSHDRPWQPRQPHPTPRGRGRGRGGGLLRSTAVPTRPGAPPTLPAQEHAPPPVDLATIACCRPGRGRDASISLIALIGLMRSRQGHAAAVHAPTAGAPAGRAARTPAGCGLKRCPQWSSRPQWRRPSRPLRLARYRTHCPAAAAVTMHRRQLCRRRRRLPRCLPRTRATMTAAAPPAR